MKVIELKPMPLLFVTRWFLLAFTFVFLAKHCAYGFSIVHDPDFLLILRVRAIEALVVAVFSSLCVAIPFYRDQLDILLVDNTLHAPVLQRGFKHKAITTNLSDITLSRTLRDRILGTRLTTNDGRALSLNAFYYAPKAIALLLDEIERRQKIIRNPSQKSEPIA